MTFYHEKLSLGATFTSKLGINIGNRLIPSIDLKLINSTNAKILRIIPNDVSKVDWFNSTESLGGNTQTPWHTPILENYTILNVALTLRLGEYYSELSPLSPAYFPKLVLIPETNVLTQFTSILTTEELNSRIELISYVTSSFKSHQKDVFDVLTNPLSDEYHIIFDPLYFL